MSDVESVVREMVQKGEIYFHGPVDTFGNEQAEPKLMAEVESAQKLIDAGVKLHEPVLHHDPAVDISSLRIALKESGKDLSEISALEGVQTKKEGPLKFVGRVVEEAVTSKKPIEPKDPIKPRNPLEKGGSGGGLSM